MASTVEALTPTGPIVTYLDGDLELTTLAPGGAWADPASDEAVPPPPSEGLSEHVFVTVRLPSGRLRPCSGGSRWLEGVYVIKAVGPVSRLRDVVAAAVRLDQMMTRSAIRGELTGWHVMGLQAEEVIEYDEVLETGRWLHRGMQYRLMVEATG
jgi:hypothetical protein